MFVRTSRPGVRLLSIHGDSDTALSQSGHGADQDNSHLKAYNSRLADPIKVWRSPANVHSMNGCESQVKRLNYLANMIRHRWYLGDPFKIDATVAAAEILNDLPVPFSANEELRKATRYQLFMENEDVSDITRWRGSPGQGAWVHMAGTKANMGDTPGRGRPSTCTRYRARADTCYACLNRSNGWWHTPHRSSGIGI